MTITFRSPIKPHYSFKELQTMAKELTEPRSTNISEFLRKESTGASFGNIDASDLKPPQLKLLAGQSPEVLDGVPEARPGTFWLTILNQNLGQSVIITPILVRVTYHVWAPRMPGSDQKGPLASSSDGIHWDVPNQSFDVKFPGNPRTYTWKLGRTVVETGAHKFGTQQDDDKNSKPIATKTYNILILVELPNGKKQLAIFTSSRTGTEPTKKLISTVKTLEIDQFYQRHRIVVQKRPGPTGDQFFSFEFQYVGEIQSVDEARANRRLYDTYVKSGFVGDTGEEANEVKPRGAPSDFVPDREGDKDEDQIPF